MMMFNQCGNMIAMMTLPSDLTNDQLRTLVIKLQRENTRLAELLAQARQARFGRKAENFSPAQLSLLDEDSETDISALEAELEKTLPAAPLATVNKPKRQALPAHLPREEIRLEPDSTNCPQCGDPLRFLRDEINEILDYIPAQFIVRKTVRPQYSCPCCQTVHSAELPAQVIDKGQAAPGLLAHITINKCVDHLPLYRQSQIFARDGITLPMSTLSDWMGKVGVALNPLVKRLHALLCEQKVLHADETPLTVLAGKKVTVQRGYLWAYASPAAAEQRMVMFDCQPGRNGGYAQTFLTGFTGTLVVDDYAGYKALFASGAIKEAGCLAHVRRKFFEQYKVNHHPLAKRVLDSIRELYKLERLIKTRTTQNRQRWRNRYAKPHLATLHALLSAQQHQVPGNSGIHKAILHALKRWPALLCYLDDGAIPIDNNHIENCIRPVALGRKNWLFAGSLLAGQRMAGIMSLLQTAKLNGIEPFTWLSFVLTHIPTWKNSQLDDLLPFAKNPFS
ncbi:transposase [Serratia sp. DD3]|nr:IS66 family transposase [Serratia sp. DD3]KEY60170.1 transposase [Serratia sp. DD3]